MGFLAQLQIAQDLVHTQVGPRISVRSFQPGNVVYIGARGNVSPQDEAAIQSNV